MFLKEAFQKKGVPGKIHTFIKMWKKGVLGGVEKNHIFYLFFIEGFPKAKEGFWGSKKFLEPQKTLKIYFLKKPKLCDLTEHWRWIPQWPLSPWCPQTPVFNSKSSNFAVA